jgi:hypothetical protein
MSRIPTFNMRHGRPLSFLVIYHLIATKRKKSSILISLRMYESGVSDNGHCHGPEATTSVGSRSRNADGPLRARRLQPGESGDARWRYIDSTLKSGPRLISQVLLLEGRMLLVHIISRKVERSGIIVDSQSRVSGG